MNAYIWEAGAVFQVRAAPDAREPEGIDIGTLSGVESLIGKNCFRRLKNSI
jgi:hypothetical protein